MLRFLLGSVLCCKEAITKEVEIGAPVSVGIFKTVPQKSTSKAGITSQNKSKLSPKKSTSVLQPPKSKLSDRCLVCRVTYGNKKDPKLCEPWIKCIRCLQWCHESCGEMYGLIDDTLSFTCADCIVE